MAGSREQSPFDTEVTRYDGWFDSADGRPIFVQETVCLRELIGEIDGRWLEVGVGTGRFAQALGIHEGVDPSLPALALAASRGIIVSQGVGENLPYSDRSMDGVLLVTTICFLPDPAKALAECHRVLKSNGRLAIGHVPADSPWGMLYARKAGEGHAFYSTARFYTSRQAIQLATDAGFYVQRGFSCLLNSPVAPVHGPPRDGIVTGAGFVAILFVKQSAKQGSEAEAGR